MTRYITLSIVLISTCMCVQAQTLRFYASNGAKIMKNATDSLLNPFSGGFNTPQFSNIDIDNDGKLDLFVFDRTSNRVAIYLYTPAGFVHAPNYNGRFPFLTQWALLRDYNNDGKVDIMTETTQDLAYLPDSLPHVTTSGLRIFVNKSNAQNGIQFLPINNQVYDTGGVWIGFGVNRAPGSVSINNSDIPCIADIDSDGDDDILSFTLTDLSPYYYENFLINKYNFQYKPDSTRYIFRDQCWGYIQYDAPSQKNQFRLGMGKDQLGSCSFQMYEKTRKHAGTTFCPIDYDGDGTMDYIYGDVGFKNLLLLKSQKNSIGRDSIVLQDSLFPSNTTRANFIEFPVAYYVDINADGKRELLVTTNEPFNAKSNDNVWVYNNSGTNNQPLFSYAGNDFWLYQSTVDLGSRAAPALIDIDNDGDEDLLVATSGSYDNTFNLNDRLVLFTNTPDVQTGRSVFTLLDSNFLNISANGPMIHVVPAIADLNGDSKEDIVLGMENGELVYFENESSGTTVIFTRKDNSPLTSIDAGAYSAPALSDIDKDGDLDLVVGNRNGILKFYRNTGTPQLALFNSNPDIDTFGGIVTRFCFNTTYGFVGCEPWGYATPVFYDVDGDSSLELIVGNDIGEVKLYRNIDTTPGGIFTLIENPFVDFSNGLNTVEKRHGRFSFPCVGKMDGDNKPDILIGNIAGGFQFYGSIPDNVNGVKEKSAMDHFNIYPNPARNECYIKPLLLDGSAEYIVYNQSGKVIRQGFLNPNKDTRISLEGVSGGMYFIRVYGHSFSQTQKLVLFD